MAIKTLVLDFDGTCTNIPAMEREFLKRSFEHLSNTRWLTEPNEWDAALKAVRAASPEAGWTQGGISSAPAAADPYILSGEAIRHIARLAGKDAQTAPDAYGYAYPLAIAPLRPELRSVLEEVDKRGIEIHFVSNASDAKVRGRINDLLADAPELSARIRVQGNARKYVVDELPWDTKIPESVRRAFQALPLAGHTPSLKRPIYLRRPWYMLALLKVWGDDMDMAKAASTLVCGDIWELDLALPSVLGCKVHLIERAAPYETYAYERDAANAAGATISADLEGLLERLDALLAA